MGIFSTKTTQKSTLNNTNENNNTSNIGIGIKNDFDSQPIANALRANNETLAAVFAAGTALNSRNNASLIGTIDGFKTDLKTLALSGLMLGTAIYAVRRFA